MATSIAATLPSLTVAIETAFTVADLRQFVRSSLPDSALQTLLDSAFAAVDATDGPFAIRELLRPRGHVMGLSREAERIVVVIEDVRFQPLTLAADDYQLSTTGQALYRLNTGTNPRWRWGRPWGRNDDLVDVTYVRPDNTADRIRVAVELVQLELNYQPMLFEQAVEGFIERFQPRESYEAERQGILSSLIRGVRDEGGFII